MTRKIYKIDFFRYIVRYIVQIQRPNLHTMYGRQNINVFISRLNANLQACNMLLSVVLRTVLDILQSQL